MSSGIHRMADSHPLQAQRSCPARAAGRPACGSQRARSCAVADRGDRLRSRPTTIRRRAAAPITSRLTSPNWRAAVCSTSSAFVTFAGTPTGATSISADDGTPGYILSRSVEKRRAAWSPSSMPAIRRGPTAPTSGSTQPCFAKATIFWPSNRALPTRPTIRNCSRVARRAHRGDGGGAGRSAWTAPNRRNHRPALRSLRARLADRAGTITPELRIIPAVFAARAQAASAPQQNRAAPATILATPDRRFKRTGHPDPCARIIPASTGAAPSVSDEATLQRLRNIAQDAAAEQHDGGLHVDEHRQHRKRLGHADTDAHKPAITNDRSMIDAGVAAMPGDSTSSMRALDHRDAIDLHVERPGPRRHVHENPRRRVVREIAVVDLVEGCEMRLGPACNRRCI